MTEHIDILDAYSILNISHDASPLQIKEQLNKFLKLYSTEELDPYSNEFHRAKEQREKYYSAYSLIKNAPLAPNPKPRLFSFRAPKITRSTSDDLNSYDTASTFNRIIWFFIGLCVGFLIIAPRKGSAFWFMEEDTHPYSYLEAIPLLSAITFSAIMPKVESLFKRIFKKK